MLQKRYIPLRKLQNTDFKSLLDRMFTVCIILIINAFTIADNIQEVLLYGLFGITALWIWIEPEYYPNCLPKELLLCPMTHKERKKYLYRHYWDKIMRNMLVVLIEVGILLAFRKIQLFGIGLLLLNQFLFSLVSHLYLDISHIVKTQKTKANALRGYVASRVIYLCIGIITGLCVIDYVIGHSKEITMGVYIMLGLQLITSIFLVARYSKPLFECGLESRLIGSNEVAKKRSKKAE